MNANNRNFWKNLLLSLAGVVVMAVLVLAVNVLCRAVNLRADFTEGRLYTLSPGTRAILGKLDTPVVIKLYRSRNPAQMPVVMNDFADRVENLLREYRSLAAGKITLQVLNPEPDSDAEDAAALDGVAAAQLPNGESLYFGLAATCLDKTVPIPFLAQDREPLLEYDITRAIYQALTPEQPSVGVVSSLPVMGNSLPPMMLGQRNGNAAWLVISELRRDFKVMELRPEEAIPGNVKVLLLIHPKGLSQQALFNIDQFLLRGGRLAAFLDPVSWADGRDPLAKMRGDRPGASTLANLLSAWGVTFDTNKIVIDLHTMTAVNDGQGRQTVLPGLLSLKADNRNAADPVTGQLTTFVLPFAGAFGGNAAPGLRKTILLSVAGDSSALESALKAQMPGEQAMRGFTPDQKTKELAIRLSGKFKTAFPKGLAARPEEKNAAGVVVRPAAPATPAGLPESARESSVILVADADMLYDRSCVRSLPAAGGKSVLVPINDNMAFLQNSVEYLCGDENLLSIRSRGVKPRPFTRVAKIQAAAQQKYTERIGELENELGGLQMRLNELQQRKKSDQKYILSPEQKKTLADARKKQADARRELKQVRKELRHDIDRLETKLEWFNIALIPAVVGLLGLALGISRKWRR